MLKYFNHENYLIGIWMYKKNVPPWYGDPDGPLIDACQCKDILSKGEAVIPSGGSERKSVRRENSLLQYL